MTTLSKTVVPLDPSHMVNHFGSSLARIPRAVAWSPHGIVSVALRARIEFLCGTPLGPGLDYPLDVPPIDTCWAPQVSPSAHPPQADLLVTTPTQVIVLRVLRSSVDGGELQRLPGINLDAGGKRMRADAAPLRAFCARWSLIDDSAFAVIVNGPSGATLTKFRRQGDAPQSVGSWDFESDAVTAATMVAVSATAEWIVLGFASGFVRAVCPSTGQEAWSLRVDSIPSALLLTTAAAASASLPPAQRQTSLQAFRLVVGIPTQLRVFDGVCSQGQWALSVRPAALDSVAGIDPALFMLATDSKGAVFCAGTHCAALFPELTTTTAPITGGSGDSVATAERQVVSGTASVVYHAAAVQAARAKVKAPLLSQIISVAVRPSGGFYAVSAFRHRSMNAKCLSGTFVYPIGAGPFAEVDFATPLEISPPFRHLLRVESALQLSVSNIGADDSAAASGAAGSVSISTIQASQAVATIKKSRGKSGTAAASETEKFTQYTLKLKRGELPVDVKEALLALLHTAEYRDMARAELALPLALRAVCAATDTPRSANGTMSSPRLGPQHGGLTSPPPLSLAFGGRPEPVESNVVVRAVGWLLAYSRWVERGGSTLGDRSIAKAVDDVVRRWAGRVGHHRVAVLTGSSASGVGESPVVGLIKLAMDGGSKSPVAENSSATEAKALTQAEAAERMKDEAQAALNEAHRASRTLPCGLCPLEDVAVVPTMQSRCGAGHVCMVSPTAFTTVPLVSKDGSAQDLTVLMCTGCGTGEFFSSARQRPDCTLCGGLLES